MNREDARKAAEVMLAYAEGKEVQYWSTSSNQWEDFITSPSFDWRHDKYRIKPKPPKPKVIPFTFEDRELFMGKIVASKSHSYSCLLVVECNSEYVWFGASASGCTYEEFLNNYTFLISLPCGKIIE